MELLWLFFLLMPWLRGIFGDENIPPRNYLRFSLVAFLLLLTFFYYKTGMERVSREHLKIIIFFSIIFSLTLLAALTPITSTDVFTYIFSSRALVLYHENPYYITPREIPDDLAVSYLSGLDRNWRSPYGPLITIIESVPALIARGYLKFHLFLTKLLSALFFFGGAYVFFKVASIYKPEKRFNLLLLFLWNPLLLFEFIQNGHLDSIMVFFLLLFFYTCLKNKLGWAALMLALAVSAKYIPLLLVPFLLKIASGSRLKISFIILGSLLFLALPFWQDTDMFQGVFGQASRSHAMIAGPLPAFLNLLIPSSHPPQLASAVIWISRLTFLFGFIFLWFYLKQKDLMHISHAVFITYFMLGTFWFLPWYISWILPQAFLLSNHRYGAMLSAAGFLIYTLAIPLWLIVLVFVFIERKDIANLFNLRDNGRVPARAVIV